MVCNHARSDPIFCWVLIDHPPTLPDWPAQSIVSFIPTTFFCQLSELDSVRIFASYPVFHHVTASLRPSHLFLECRSQLFNQLLWSIIGLFRQTINPAIYFMKGLPHTTFHFFHNFRQWMPNTQSLCPLPPCMVRVAYKEPPSSSW